MAISKLILNGETQMDVTSNTNTSNNMLSGVVGTKNDGTTVTGSIATKTSSDLIASGATVTAPAGYYANAASKAVATATHPNPSASIASATGVVTASHTQGTGYVTGGTTTGTLSLTTQAGKTVTPTETAQTAVASYRWTTGPISVAAISSTYVGTGVAKKSSADLTASGSTVTAPAGYYSTAATKNISAGSAFPPAVTITKAPTIGVNTSGVVTASYNGSSSITPTVSAGYVSQGTAGTISTTGTSTYQLTSKAAATYYPSTADQTIASQRWLVGNQTIKSVTTSNLTAENIAEGVVVKVGDSSNASRITQITGTHKSSGLTCTMTGGSSGTRGVFLGSEPYYTSFTFNAGDTLEVFVNGSSDWDAYLYINNELILGPQTSAISYNITPNVDFSIQFTSGNHTYKAYVTIPEINITENGQHEVGGYGYANVNVEPTYTATFLNTHTGDTNVNFTYNGIKSTNLGSSFTFHAGDTIVFTCPSDYYPYIQENNKTIAQTAPYTYTLPAYDIGIEVFGQGTPSGTIYAYLRITLSQIDITENGNYDVADYARANVNATGEYYGIYKALANGQYIYTGGSTYYSYTAQDVQDYCDSLSSIYNNQFVQRNFVPSGITFNNVTTIGEYAFGSIYNNTTSGNYRGSLVYSFPSLLSIKEAAFIYNFFIREIYAPVCTSIGTFTFANCYSLTTASFPLATYVGGYAFDTCRNLTTANFPSVTSIGGRAFDGCDSLTSANFPACTTIGSYAFSGCYNLLSLYLLGSSVPTLANKNVFLSTPISTYTTSTGGVYGSIYVPASLYDSYITATNWSIYSARIVSV